MERHLKKKKKKKRRPWPVPATQRNVLTAVSPAYYTKREKNPHNRELPILIGNFFFFFVLFAFVIRFSPISSFPLDFNQIYTKTCDCGGKQNKHGFSNTGTEHREKESTA
jgi:hypothetical protein